MQNLRTPATRTGLAGGWGRQFDNLTASTLATLESAARRESLQVTSEARICALANEEIPLRGRIDDRVNRLAAPLNQQQCRFTAILRMSRQLSEIVC